MDRDWTPIWRRPEKLYRLCRIGQYTRYAENEGFTARDLKTRFYGPENIFALLQSIDDHRKQTSKQSPYISLFEDEGEAEMWALAAEQVFEADAKIMVINAWDECLSNTPMWRLSDIERQTGFKFSDGADSEWLALNYIPAPAIQDGKIGQQIRHERELRPPMLDVVPPMGRYSFSAAVQYEKDASTAAQNNSPFNSAQLDVAIRECPCLFDEYCTHPPLD